VTVVIVALVALGFMTSYIVSGVGSDDAKPAIATTSLGVTSAIVGAFFGVKAASDSSKSAQDLIALAHASDPNDPAGQGRIGNSVAPFCAGHCSIEGPGHDAAPRVDPTSVAVPSA
jgi:hypothetical protein